MRLIEAAGGAWSIGLIAADLALAKAYTVHRACRKPPAG